MDRSDGTLEAEAHDSGMESPDPGAIRTFWISSPHAQMFFYDRNSGFQGRFPPGLRKERRDGRVIAFKDLSKESGRLQHHVLGFPIKEGTSDKPMTLTRLRPTLR